jgi:glutaryl-CoA dehydrogenase
MTVSKDEATYEDIGRALTTDYFFLREQLSEDQLDYLTRTRRFVDDEVIEVIGDYWERAEFPWPLVKRLGSWGWSVTACWATAAPRWIRSRPAWCRWS